MDQIYTQNGANKKDQILFCLQVACCLMRGINNYTLKYNKSYLSRERDLQHVPGV